MPLTRPLASEVHVDRPLTNFAQLYLQGEDTFVANMAFPNIPSAKQSDLYYVFDRDDYYRDEAAIREDGTESAGGGFKLSTESFRAEVFAFHKLVTDRQRSNQDDAIRLDESATRYVTQKHLIRRERAMVDALFTAARWGSYTAPNVNWSGGTDDPIVQVRTAIRTVQENTGYRPNKILIGRHAYDTLLDNDSILARITGGAMNAMPAQVQRELLAMIFEVNRVMVVDAMFTSTPEGDSTPSRQFIGGDNMLVYYAPDSVGMFEPTAGTRFDWTGYMGDAGDGIIISNIRDEHKKADKIEGEMAFDFKQTGVDLGYFFSSVSN